MNYYRFETCNYGKKQYLGRGHFAPELSLQIGSLREIGTLLGQRTVWMPRRVHNIDNVIYTTTFSIINCDTPGVGGYTLFKARIRNLVLKLTLIYFNY